MTDLTNDDVRQKVKETVWTLRHLAQQPNSMPQRYRSWWPDIVHTPDEAYGWATPKVTRQRPTASQIKAMDEMLPLLYALAVEERRAVLLHGIPLGWRKIGRELGISHMTAKRWEESAVTSLRDMMNDALRRAA